MALEVREVACNTVGVTYYDTQAAAMLADRPLSQLVEDYAIGTRLQRAALAEVGRTPAATARLRDLTAALGHIETAIHSRLLGDQRLTAQTLAGVRRRVDAAGNPAFN